MHWVTCLHWINSKTINRLIYLPMLNRFFYVFCVQHGLRGLHGVGCLLDKHDLYCSFFLPCFSELHCSFCLTRLHSPIPFFMARIKMLTRLHLCFLELSRCILNLNFIVMLALHLYPATPYCIALIASPNNSIPVFFFIATSLLHFPNMYKRILFNVRFYCKIPRSFTTLCHGLFPKSIQPQLSNIACCQSQTLLTLWTCLAHSANKFLLLSI